MQSVDMERYLAKTPLLDFDHPRLTQLAEQNDWCALAEQERIGAVYRFVRDDIKLGYNASDEVPASRVLQDGYGQCNTKATLLMALLRKCAIPCRLHGFTVDKRLQKGVIKGIAYRLAPRNIIHSWVEVWYRNRWTALEGVIVDTDFLKGVQSRFPEITGAFCGYAVATANLSDPPIAWCGADTYIQKEAITGDLGVFDSPDAFYAKHGSNLNGIQLFLYQWIFQPRINRNVASIRRGVDGVLSMKHRATP